MAPAIQHLHRAKIAVQKLRLTVQPLFYTVPNPSFCAVSSVVEHYLDTVGVTGSNPVSRTIFDSYGSRGHNGGHKVKCLHGSVTAVHIVSDK